MNSSIDIQTDQRQVTTITFNRPEVRNAFDDQMIEELGAALVSINADDTTRCVVLTGAGSCFSGGANIEWMRSMAGLGLEENIVDAVRLAELMALLNGLSKPTIARVNGHAFGGGVGLIACCDIAVAGSEARFALSEVRLGLVPAVISPYVIAAIGARQARRFFLTGEAMDANTARDIGLVHQVAADAEIESVVSGIVNDLLKGGPAALYESKELIAMVSHNDRTSLSTIRKRTSEIIAQLRVSDEGQEGLGAFLEKRKPRWSL